MLISCTVIYFVFKQIKINNYFYYFQENFFDLKIIFYVLVLFFIINIIIALRWYFIINYSKKNIPFIKVLRASLYSNIFTTLSIPTLADVSRVIFLKQDTVNKKELAVTVVIDRFIGLTSKIIYAIFVMFFLNLYLKIHFFNNYLYIFVFFLVILFLLFKFMNSNVIAKLFSKFKILKETIRSAKKNYNIKVFDFVCLALFSLLIHFILALLFYLICSQANIPNIIIISLLSPILIIAGQIPFFFGGWGIREITFISIFSFFSITSDISFSVSIYFGLISTSFSFIFLMIWLFESFAVKIFTNK